MRRLPLLLTTSLLALAAVGAATADAATFGVSIGGTQVTEWSYQGHQTGSCNVPVDGQGTQKLDFRTARPAKAALNRAGRFVLFTAAPAVDATGSRDGTFTVHNAADAGCTGRPDEQLSQAGCGNKSYRLDRVFVDAGVSAPQGDVRVQATTGNLSLFNDCPWFEGPDDQSYIDQDAGDGAVNNDVYGKGGGLRFTHRKLPLHVLRLRPGRSLTLPMGLTKVYAFHDEFGDLHGETRLTMHLVIKRCRVASFTARRC